MKVFSILAAVLVCFLILFYAVTFQTDTSSVPPTPIVSPQIGEMENTPSPTMTPKSATEKELALSALMKESFGAVSGTCQWGVYTFGDSSYIYNRSEAVPSASVIKLFIMEYAFALMERGSLTMEDTIEGVSVKSLVERMITVSDNNATNAFIDYFGMEKLNAYFTETGYSDTQINRRMLDYDAMANGIENYTSVLDVMQFLRKLYDNKDAFPYKDMLDIMKRQTVRTKLPVKLPDGIVVAHKTGELDTVENDVGIIFTEKEDFAIVCLCSSLSDRGSARSAISSAALRIYQKILE